MCGYRDTSSIITQHAFINFGIFQFYILSTSCAVLVHKFNFVITIRVRIYVGPTERKDTESCITHNFINKLINL